MTKEKKMFIVSSCLVCFAVAIVIVPHFGMRFGFMQQAEITVIQKRNNR